MEIPVIIAAGQSNAGPKGKWLQLDPVAPWAQTTAQGWEGHPTQSSDTGVTYLRPTLANFPCLYIENNLGQLDCIANGWGNYLGFSPYKKWAWDNAAGNYAYNPDGTHVYAEGSQEVGGYSPLLPFMWKWKQANPNSPNPAVISVSLGGSSINDWSVGSLMWNVLKMHLDQAKARLAAAGLTPRWDVMLWIHGESGWANANASDQFAVKTRNFLAAVRGETSQSMKCGIARISLNMREDAVLQPFVTVSRTLEQIRVSVDYRRADQDAIAADPGNFGWSQDGIPPNLADAAAVRYHFASSGILADGERAYASYEGAPPPPPPLMPYNTYSLNVNGQVQNFVVGDKLEWVNDNGLKLKATVNGSALAPNVPWGVDLQAGAQ